MFLMYVDESGDDGLVNSPTEYFVLSGLILHELTWRNTLDKLIEFRRTIKNIYNVPIRQEIHANEFLNKPQKLSKLVSSIPKNIRLSILKKYADALIEIKSLNIINVIVNKKSKDANYDVFGMAWKVLIQRFENTINSKNFNGPKNEDDTGILIPDNTNAKKLNQLLRQMRRYNTVPHQPYYGKGYRNIKIKSIIEDPWFKDSKHSYFIQAADLIAFLLFQSICPNNYMKNKGGRNYFYNFEKILSKQASEKDAFGRVWL